MSDLSVLYVKGMDVSESEEDDGNVWDDRKLNDAYDKAIKIANAEIAKRVAMSTNTQTKKDIKQNSNKNKKQQHKTKGQKIDWQVGMPCRALYEEDGLEYEAFIVSIINEKDCIIQFLGYNNLQMVGLDSLHPSLDTQEHKPKVEQIRSERADDGFESQSPNADDMESITPATTQIDSIKELYQTRKKSGKKKNKQKTVNNFTLPDIPMPDMSMFRNLGSMDMPLPPPPPQLSMDAVQTEQQAVSSMLLSWYMSGYYTGLYQGMKRAKESRHGK